ncbi:MAG TPA: PIN domain-containing protein [Candidatus Limnocylindria bacterium]|nr:PIN domain-containing protein [Candidatus Limnocylindria bacterium]
MSGKRWSIETLVSAHRRVALDADVLIYLIDDAGVRAQLAAVVVDAIEAGLLQGSMSALAHAEVLVGPARTGDASVFEETASELRGFGLEIRPVTPEVAEDAAWLRGRGDTHLVDALHLASARASATAFVTNDRRLRASSGLDVYYLDDLDTDPPTSAVA